MRFMLYLCKVRTGGNISRERNIHLVNLTVSMKSKVRNPRKPVRKYAADRMAGGYGVFGESCSLGGHRFSAIGKRCK